MIGSGGVGDAAARIAAERDFFELWVVADYDGARAERTVAAVGARHTGSGAESRFVAVQVDASSAGAVAALAREHRATHVFNAVDPKFTMPIFTGAAAAGANYLDMAMSLSQRHPELPHERVGVKLGDEQFAVAGEWEAAGRLALVGMGVEPGLSDVFARYAADHLFEEIDELGTRDGANLVVRDATGNEVFAPSFSMWTTIEECLNPLSSGRRTGDGSRPSPSASRRSSTSPAGSGRSSASTSSTRRCSSCRGGSTRSE
jgi:saccharopine dehydrogenase-like NADP-dependent oxidoreductase